MLAAGEVKGISPKCREYFNPLTKGKVTVCDGEPKKPEESSKFEGKPEISEPIPPTDPNFQVTDYQYGIYCQAMNWLNERKSLVEVGSAYDALFDGVEKVNEHSFDAFKIGRLAQYLLVSNNINLCPFSRKKFVGCCRRKIGGSFQ